MFHRPLLLSLAAMHTVPEDREGMFVKSETPAEGGGGDPPKAEPKAAPPVETHEVEVDLPETPAAFFREGKGKPREDELPVENGFRRFSNTSNTPRDGEKLVRSMGPTVKQRLVKPVGQS